MLGKNEGRRRRGQQRMRGLDGFTDTMDMNLGKLQETLRAGRPGVLQSMRSQRVGHDLVTEQQQHQYLFLYMRVLVLKSESCQVYTIDRWQCSSLVSDLNSQVLSTRSCSLLCKGYPKTSFSFMSQHASFCYHLTTSPDV